jgi:sulfofructose kinase
MKYEIVGIDSPCMDLVINLKKFPQNNLSYPIEQLSWQGGGKIATGLVAAARLGIKGAIVGNIGDDAYGRFCLHDFEEHGIDINGLMVRQGKTTNFSVVLSDEEYMGRSILYDAGSSEIVTIDEITRSYLTDTRYLFVSMLNETVKKAIDISRNAGAKIVIDADTYTDDLLNCISDIDIFIGSEFVYNKIFSDTKLDYESNLRELSKQGPEIVVFTFGENGARGFSKEGFFETPAYDIKVQDTVGAGDVFHGAFIVGLIRGLSVEETTKFASAASAIKCTRIGGRAGIPDYNTTIKFMQTGVIDYSEIDDRVNKYRKGLEYV